MAIGTVIHGDDDGAGGSGTGYIGVFANYNDLIAAFPTAPTMSLAYVQNSQGTKWLPGGLGGNFYSKGSYLFDGVNWVSSVDEISEELQNILDNINTQTLAQVLAEGNTTGAFDILVDNNQVIKASIGNSQINLRNFGVDGQIDISGNGIQLVGGTYFVDPAVGNVSISSSGTSLSLFKGDLSKIGDISILNNELSSVNTFNFDGYPVGISTKNTTFNVGVVNSVAEGGSDIIVKTDGASYRNKSAYNDGTAGELIVNHTPSATDRTQTHQDKDGIIALLSDILQQFNVDLDSSESSVSRVFSGGRTTFTVTHNLGTLDIKPQVFRLSDGRNVGWRLERTGINTIDVSRNGNIADGLFRLVI